MGYGFQHEGKTFTPEGTPPRVETTEECEARNAALAAAEVEAFKAHAADRWFAYWRGGHSQNIVTFTGEPLARVTWVGHEYESPGFGRCSTRVNFRAEGIDGRTWAGTYYKSSGDYVRMRVVKSL